MGILKDIVDAVDNKLFIDKNGKRVQSYITGDRFNAGMGVKMPQMQLKKDVAIKPVKENKVYTEDPIDVVKKEEKVVQPVRTNNEDTTLTVKENDTNRKGVNEVELSDDKLSLKD